jgi:hypothetical protein
VSFPLHALSFTKGDHICLCYRDWQDQISISAPFVEIGLRREERCLCILPEDRQLSLLEALKDRGINPRMELERGALVLLSPEQTYLRDGTFDSARMVELWEAIVKESLSLGFECCRAMGDLSWAAQSSACCARLPQYEAVMDRFYPGKPALGLCLYDTRLFAADQLRDLMNLHRFALSSPDPFKRAIRIREGRRYGDIIFDRRLASVFHYTVREDDSTEFLGTGQESSLAVALAKVKNILSQRRSGT